MTTKQVTEIHVCLLVLILLHAVAKASTIANPGCSDTCGNVSIPFPFGMGPNDCFLDPWFEIECNTSDGSSNSSKKPFLKKLEIELLEVILHANYSASRSVIVNMPPLKVCGADTRRQQLSSINLRGSPYNFSTNENVFIMEGCPGSAVLVDQDQSNAVVKAGCGTVCHNNNTEIPSNSCYGVHCCQTLLPSEILSPYSTLQFYQMDFNRQPSGEHQGCLAASLIKSDSVDQYVGRLSSSDLSSAVPVVLIWGWLSKHKPHNNRHTTCWRDLSNALSCMCESPYHGKNAYVSDGCQAPEGCEGCQGSCESRDGGGYICVKKPLLSVAAIYGLMCGFGMLLLVACFYMLYRFIKRRMEMRRRNKFFKRNGGLLLKQQLASDKGVVERTKIFTISELEKATDHFSKNRILGQGGQGTVYKGMLADGSIAAIKKSVLLDESQLEQFINEVVVLSRINHKHVVKLFGCCLETEVPLLVYEFIPNGTLYHHIRDSDEDIAISWAKRLKIAADSAGAIAYLHSSASMPIYHRDIKSSNILLDEKHRAKVSDFGSSKTIAIDQTHLTTVVQGTMGYLDPEYFKSYQFTEKSDVYSFGVVLLELLTSKKPIYRDTSTMEQKNLVMEFSFLTQKLMLSEILDPKIVTEATEDELKSVVELAIRCTCWSGKLRPTMKEVAMTLEMIMKSPAQVSAWYQQQEPFSIQYAAYDEFDMTHTSDSEFMSITLPYSDESPLLSDAI